MPEIGHVQVANYAISKINLASAKAKEHREQVNNLRTGLQNKIDQDSRYDFVKSLHAGSVAKRTALSNVSDLDLAVYVEVSDSTASENDLVHWLADRLFEATTNMRRDQFVANPHCVTVHFKGTGLDVDVVPVLYEGDQDDLGYLINKNTGDRLLTSVKLHLDFIARRRSSYGPEFLELIRITKWWKRQVQENLDSEFKFKSFMIELIWAHLADSGTPLMDYTLALESFFEWIVKTELKSQMAFTDFHAATEIPLRGNTSIEILDPVNFDNNVAIRYADSQRRSIVARAGSALDALTEARFAPTKGQAVDNWREILGTGFRG